MPRTQVVQVGPLASPTATKISLTQKAAISGTNYLVLNGAAGSFSATSVAGSQTPAGATALTLAAGAGNLPLGSRIYITTAANESGVTFAVVGKRYGGVTPGGYAVTETITGASTSTVSSINQYDAITSITPSGATSGAITVGHYTIATLDVPRRVLFTPGGADSGISYVITGTDWAGLTISETLAGVDNPSTTYTVLDYKTVTSITTSGAMASTATVGTNGIASSQWASFDGYYGSSISGQTDVSGTVNYTIQQTLDDPNSTSNPVAPASVTWIAHPDSAVVASTTAKQFNYAYQPAWARILLNSNTNPGYVTATFRQPYQG